MSTERTVAIVTGTRAEYGLLRGTMRAIERHEALQLAVVATGMHLSPLHGSTIEEIQSDGFEVNRIVPMLLAGDDSRHAAKSVGIGLSGLADAFGDIAPDILLVLGDRGEALAAAVAAAFQNVPVAHVHGGDAMKGATIDDSTRHAITKFSHIHFPASPRSRARIECLGEQPWRITTVGAPGLDEIIAGEYEDPADVRDSLDLADDRSLIVVVQHPVTTRPEAAGEEMRTTLDAVSGIDTEVVVIYPNADAGGQRMIETIEAHPDRQRFRVVNNLSRGTYLGLLAAADALVGNSSSGIIEAPSFDLPVVDIGPRQDGRDRADNVLEVSHDEEAIMTAVRRCLEDEVVRERARSCSNPYDQGGAAKEIVSTLAGLELDERLLRKELTY